MTEWDAPNQQVVRADQSPPWEEGTGGGGDAGATPKAVDAGDRDDLDSLTKAQLLDYARELGVSPANNLMSKDELRAAIDEKLAEGG